ncbi:MAG: hypothetical protein Q9160_006619 [Pyrenula sp. 1 TL-2023]
MANLERSFVFEDYLVTNPFPNITQVFMNRPQKHNAFTARMWKDFGALFDQLSQDSRVRAIVLSGSGKNFTVGLDLEEARQGNILNGTVARDPARKAQHIRRYIDEFQRCVSALERCEKQAVICVLHGLCYGIAIDISSCADVRICSSDAQFSVKEVDIGIAADLGSLSRLPNLVGSASWVKDVCLSARPFDAQEALRQGFVSEVMEGRELALERAMAIAKSLILKSPVAIQSTKEILNHARDHSVHENLRYTAIWNAASIQTRDVPESIEAWQHKRMPRYEKL